MPILFGCQYNTIHYKTLFPLILLQKQGKHELHFQKRKYLCQTRGNVRIMKPVQNCTGFIFCTFPAVVHI